MPSMIKDLLNLFSLEFDRYKEFGPFVNQWVNTDKDLAFQINPHD
ncbi:MAG: hypothetical protein P1V20_01395 [Verrucomicrobiales bacterium]|nr:hypothetical protein [Verrucomicrobiales bacterium]